MKNMTAERIDKAIARFSDPQVNYQVWLASTPEVAKVIIKGLPGVKELVEVGPDAGRSMIALLDSKEMQKNDRVSAIALYVLSQFPSEEVKQALAKDIAARRFRGISSQLAAEAFLTAARIDAPQEEAITVALREAQRLQPANNLTSEKPSGLKPQSKSTPKQKVGAKRQKSLAATHKRSVKEKKFATTEKAGVAKTERSARKGVGRSAQKRSKAHKK